MWNNRTEEVVSKVGLDTKPSPAESPMLIHREFVKMNGGKSIYILAKFTQPRVETRGVKVLIRPDNMCSEYQKP